MLAVLIYYKLFHVEMISSNKTVTLECWTIFPNPYWYSYIVYIFIDEQFHVWKMIFCFVSPVVSSRMLWKLLHWNVFRMFKKVFFFKIFRKFSVYSIQAKMSCSKFQLFARMNRKNLSLDGKMKVTDYANKNPSRMSGNCRTFQYWKDLRLKYIKERKNSSKGIWIFQRKLRIETRTNTT